MYLGEIFQNLVIFLENQNPQCPYILFCATFPLNLKSKILKEKNLNLGTYSKNIRILEGHFFKHKPLIIEEC